MKAITTLILVSFTLAFSPGDFLAEQKKYQRVRTALNEKGKLIADKLKEKNITVGELNILIVAYKAESELNVYGKSKTGSAFELLSTYRICSASGEPGPKRRQGDGQVPEGFYTIDRFNPASSFYLSLGVSYPNQSDRKKSKFRNPGGDIFIHGSCVTIGCMPMTDDKIKEIYLYAVYAKQNGQINIPVYIFPFKMTESNFSDYTKRHKDDPELVSFWTNLKQGFDRFEANKNQLKYSVDNAGNYTY